MFGLGLDAVLTGGAPGRGAIPVRVVRRQCRVVSHARRLIIRLGAGTEALATIVTARQTIRALACGPAG